MVNEAGAFKTPKRRRDLFNELQKKGEIPRRKYSRKLVRYDLVEVAQGAGQIRRGVLNEPHYGEDYFGQTGLAVSFTLAGRRVRKTFRTREEARDWIDENTDIATEEGRPSGKRGAELSQQSAMS